MKITVVVDAQNDFVYGVLGSCEASDAVGNMLEVLMQVEENDFVIFTRDTHGEHYLDTQEGRNLPVPHCVYGTEGWQIVNSVDTCVCKHQKMYINKPIFGSYNLVDTISEMIDMYNADEIELFGFCTDICVISNALMLKSAFPEVHISVRENCCAGTTEANHAAAIAVMKSCQIAIV